MKPFDLEKAKAGHPLITRDGRAAKFLLHVPEAKYEYARVVFLVDGEILFRRENGMIYFSGEMGGDVFLAEKPKVKKSAWGFVATERLKASVRTEAETRKNAEHEAKTRGEQLTVVRVEWEEEE